MRRAGQVYEDCRRLEDALRCYREGLDFHSTLRLLYANRRYEEGVEAVRHYEDIKRAVGHCSDLKPPAADMTERKLLWTAARMHYKEGNRDKMDAVVDTFPEFEFKVKFYKNLGLSGQVVQTLLKAGRTREARDMLYDAHDYRQAARVDAGDNAFKAECSLLDAAKLFLEMNKNETTEKRAIEAESLGNEAQKEVAETQTSSVVTDKQANEAQKEIIEKQANEAWKLFGSERDSVGQGIATLLIAVLKRSLVDAQKARASFQSAKADCLAGEVEAATHLMKAKLKTDSELKAAQHTLPIAAELYRCLHAGKSTSDNQQVEKCFRFYGLREVGTSQYETNELYSIWMKLDEARRFTHAEAQSMLSVRALQLLKTLVESGRSQLLVQVEKSRLCIAFKTGQGCAGVEGGCRRDHDHSSESVLRRMKVLEKVIEFEATISTVLGNIQKSNNAGAVVKNIQSRAAPVVELLSELIWSGGHSSSLACPSSVLADALLKLSHKCKDFVHKALDKAFRETHFMSRLCDVNFTHQMWSLYQSFVLKSNPLPKFLHNEEYEFNERLQRSPFKRRSFLLQKTGALVNKDSFWAKLFVRLWVDAQHMLYRDSNFVKASSTLLKRFLTRPLKMTSLQCLPNVSVALSVMESEILYCLTLAIHLQQPVRLRACMPLSYIESVRYWNVLVMGNVEWHLREIRKCKNQRNILKKVRDLLQYAVDLFLGIISDRFSLLGDSLLSSLRIESGESERCVTLALVLLINSAVGFTVPSKNEVLIRKALARLAVQLQSTVATTLPLRLLSCLDEISSAVVVGDLVHCLEKLLRERGEFVCDVVVNSSRQVCYVETKIDEYYEDRPLMKMDGDDDDDCLTANGQLGIKGDDDVNQAVPSMLAGEDGEEEELEDEDDMEQNIEQLPIDEMTRLEKEVRNEEADLFRKRQLLKLYFGEMLRKKHDKVSKTADGNENPEERFSRYDLDDRGCLVCDVTFVRPEEDGEELRNSNTIPVFELQTRQTHEGSSGHWTTWYSFLTYRKFYCNDIYPVFHSVRRFLHTIRESEVVWLGDRMELEMSDLEGDLNSLERKVVDNEKQRKWDIGIWIFTEPTEALRNKLTVLQKQIDDIRQQESHLHQPDTSEVPVGDVQNGLNSEDHLLEDGDGDDLADVGELSVDVEERSRNQKKHTGKRRRKGGRKK